MSGRPCVAALFSMDYMDIMDGMDEVDEKARQCLLFCPLLDAILTC